MSEKYTAKQAIGELQEYRNLLMEDPSDSVIDTGCVMAKAMELFLKIEQANGINSEPANFAIFDVSQQRELFFELLKYAMPNNYTDEVIRNIVTQFVNSKNCD